MVGFTRMTPLDLLHDSFVKKTYAAIVCSDGTVLPIEERIGRRILRVIEPGSREARDLIARGIVVLKRADGRAATKRSVAKVARRRNRDH